MSFSSTEKERVRTYTSKRPISFSISIERRGDKIEIRDEDHRRISVQLISQEKVEEAVNPFSSPSEEETEQEERIGRKPPDEDEPPVEGDQAAIASRV